MTISLRNRLVLTYSLFICVFIVLLSFVINRLASGLFEDFVLDSSGEQSRQAAQLVAEQYSPATGEFDIAALRIIAINHSRQGLIITVEDTEGLMLWTGDFHSDIARRAGMDIYTHGHGHGFGRGRQMGMRMRRLQMDAWAQSPVINPGTDYPRHIFAMTHGDRNIGRVIVEIRTPYFFSEIQLAFVNSFRRFLMGTGIAFGLLSIVITALLSNTLSKPILGAASAAMRMADGDWSARAPEGYRTREIDELSRSLNHLVTSLENGDKWQKQLTANVAHELRTPLTTLQGNMEAMIDGVWEASAERLASCHEEIVRLSALVGDLEKLSILERKVITLSRTEFDLRALLAGVAEQFEPAAMKKGLSLSLFSETSPIHADSGRIKQVFVNLLSNAVNYTDRGSITVSVSAAEEGYTVAVADTGIGIAQEDLPHVFERFFRSDKSRSRQTGGAGIGLAIAQAIVLAHGGRIQVSSEAGAGSIFAVFLPKR